MGRMGRVGRLGRVDGPEKCPLNFFILCGYIDYVYVLLEYEIKIVTNILMGFKIYVKLAVVVKNFEITEGKGNSRIRGGLFKAQNLTLKWVRPDFEKT